MRLLPLCLALAAALVCLPPDRARAEEPPAFWTNEWPNTDFSRASIAFAEVISGGPPRDGIPAIDDPVMLPVAEADIPGREPVIALELPGEVPRAYPLRYLTWHEIVNDRAGSVPVAVTFCPLCNSAITFDRRLGDQVLTFGVSGKLRNSDMIMFDRETESWWQQFTGTGIVGALNGAELTVLPSWMESLDAFRDRNKEGLVMARPNAVRPYGRNPYAGYDGLNRPFLYSGDPPPHGIEPLSRVVVVGDRAWPLSRLAGGATIEEAGLTLSWEGVMASALDTARISDGREISSIRVRDRNGQDVPHDTSFAFAFHAFHPDGTWMLGE
ncbi:DUF3179 domain-containing protein [Oceanomicrobium pacificus]|uniref:DUF3179 domain-containing protein n=1 Tax=Oceanomicrobium pacificus TaxID=2692916 RepID=A0A6B0TXY9_9RHOB|nr:DUF3179 domain-containing protein [Oceanomicrobium pacificus]MXU65873.1 DUF3179 domain-containing protein [Oceanomicrobium pacificus]